MSGSERGADPSPVALAAAVVAALRDRSQTLATAESLTGGLVGATLTDVPGASAVYRGGLIVYATGLKAALARVSAQTLATDGPVAASTAGELARGAAAACGADWGLATTGVAGPDPQDGHPVGQVFVAVAGPWPDGATDGLPEGDHQDVLEVRELALAGDRAAIRDLTTRAVLRLLLDRLGDARSYGRSAPSGVET
jgi:nicotinamide-nucleotide amidase